jgi:hypothetical protein
MADNSNPKDGSTYIPLDRIIPGNSTPHNPMANNPLRDPVSPNPPVGR